MTMKLDQQGRVIQPGPPIFPRMVAVPCRARRVQTVLQPGRTLVEAVAEALPGCSGAALELHGGGFGPMHYVWPDYARTAEHAAFYSDLLSPPGETQLEHARMTFGRRDGAPWLHCHGFWTDADGRRSGGHVLPDQAVVSSPISATAFVLEGAAFETQQDSEINFNLLGPVSASAAGEGEVDAIALRLRPGVDFADTLQRLVAQHGWSAATIAGGVGSLVGVHFAAGAGFSPRPTELFITDAYIRTDSADITLSIIDHEGTRLSGTLQGLHVVLMTMELVLLRLPCAADPDPASRASAI
jgi:predicted DNA-binding protein with PD1-like motif